MTRVWLVQGREDFSFKQILDQWISILLLFSAVELVCGTFSALYRHSRWQGCILYNVESKILIYWWSDVCFPGLQLTAGLNCVYCTFTCFYIHTGTQERCSWIKMKSNSFNFFLDYIAVLWNADAALSIVDNVSCILNWIANVYLEMLRCLSAKPFMESFQNIQKNIWTHIL